MAFGGAGCSEPASCKLQLSGRDPGMPIVLYLEDYFVSWYPRMLWH